MRLQKLIPIFDGDTPYFYIVYESDSDRYRVSFAYRYLKNKYKLDTHIYRNFNDNTISKMIDKLIFIEEYIDHDDSNYVKAKKYRFDKNNLIFHIVRHFDNRDSCLIIHMTSNHTDITDIIGDNNVL